MKVTCEIVILDRNSNILPKPRPCKGYVAIFRESSKKPIQLRVCTNSKPAVNYNLVKEKIEKIFSNHLDKGIMTVRFQTPSSVDLMLSRADPVHLTAFHKVLKLAAAGEECPSNAISSVGHAAVVPDKLKGPSSLKIDRRRDYPFWKPWPTSVEDLSVKNCNLIEFDNRLLKLKHLRTLTLTGNDFSAGRLDNVAFSCLENLWYLNLTGNQIDKLPVSFYKNLPPALKDLSLAMNSLTTVPDALFEKKGLRVLDLSMNQLTKLNPNLGVLGVGLKKLIVGGNPLRVLPASVLNFKLELLGLGGTAFMSKAEVDLERSRMANPNESALPPLVELAALSVVEKGLPITELPVSLQELVRRVALSRCPVCIRCSCPSNVTIAYCMLNNQRLAAQVVSDSGPPAVLEGVCCSMKCARLFVNGRF